MVRSYARRRKQVRSRRIPRNLVRFVKKTITKTAETKQQVLSVNGASVGTVAIGGGLNYNLTQIAQGNDVHQREGNMIRITGFYARFAVTYADTTNVVRFHLWQPRGDNSVTGSSLEVYDLVDIDKARMFKDVTVVVGNSGPMIKLVTIAYKWKKPLTFRYYDTAIGNNVTPPIFLSVVSDSGVASHPTITGNWRLYYKE